MGRSSSLNSLRNKDRKIKKSNLELEKNMKESLKKIEEYKQEFDKHKKENIYKMKTLNGYSSIPVIYAYV